MNDYTPADMEHAETLAKQKLPEMIKRYGGDADDWVVRFTVNIEPFIRVSFIHTTDSGHDEYRYSARPDGLIWVGTIGKLKLS